MRESRCKMGQFWTILRFEFGGYLKNKVFVGVTVFLVILIAALMFFPRIAVLFESEEPSESDEKAVMLVSSDSDIDVELLAEAFSGAFSEYDVRKAQGDAEWIKEQILSGGAECAFVVSAPTSYTYYVDNLSMYDVNTAVADEVLLSLYRMSAVIENGVPADKAGEILSASVTHETEKLGKDQMQNFFYTYIMIFALYMVILLYGQMVATNVASEKSSRAMEVLVTSAKPTSMMFGKVVASCLAGLLQLVVVFGSALAFYNLNKSYWGDNAIIGAFFDIPLDLLVYMLVFFVLGFFIYAFMYGAIGSTASKLEDINTSVMPVTLLFIIGFFVVVFSMSSGNIDNTLMSVCSFIPFTSPMAMFTRIAMSTVPVWEIGVSIAILIVSVFGVGAVSAKIYRVGVLLYGTTPRLGAILKAIRKA